MDFGLFSMFSTREGSSQSQIFDEWFGLVRLAEDAGLDTFWFGESHFRPHRAVMASPLIGASAASSMTSRIGMGLAVQVLPLANPLRVAEEAAMVDHISQGRLLFGVGRSSFIESYHGYNVDYAESRSLFFESLEVIQKAWSESPFSYHGEHFHFDDVDLVPKPLQNPHPPIRVAVESRETFPSSAVWVSLFSSGIKWIYPRSRSCWRGTRLKRISEVTYDEVLTRVAYGTPEAVVERIRWYQEELGITGVSLDMNPGGQLPHQQVVDSIKLLAEKVVPEFR